MARMWKLNKLLAAQVDDEIHRHIIASSISVLQTFHRGTIIKIVDAGEEYKVRAAENVAGKILLKDALNWLGGKTVSFGELFAHTVPCNSVTDLLSPLNALLACDTKRALASAVNASDLRNRVQNPKPVVPDVDGLMADLAEAFRLRHILAHEAAPFLKVSKDQCKTCLAAVAKWVDGVDAVLWATVYRDTPLTTVEMRQDSMRELHKARQKLAGEMRTALSDARSRGAAPWLRGNHFAWMKATMDWTHNTYSSLDGTMWPPIAASDLAQAIRARAEQVEAWNKRHPEQRPTEAK